VVARLPERGADVSAKDRYGRTALWWAAAEGQEAVVQQLLSHDDVEVNVEDEVGRTALRAAARGGHKVVVE
jgi:ankyrin repeat protein